MSKLYDRINDFCCLSAIRNKELFKDTDYKDVYELVDDLSILKKQLEAIEIIKEKQVDIMWFKCCSSSKDYNNSVPSYKHITQEEFDILNKAFGNE